MPGLHDSANLLERLSTLAVTAICFIVYSATAFPGLTYTDSGELAAACIVWGVAHPTGYPLFTLLGHLWSMLPWAGDVGSLNIFSALIAALSVGMIILVSRNLLNALWRDQRARNNLISILTGLIFGASPVVWQQGTSLEVYGLHLLLVLLTLYCAIRFISAAAAEPRWLALTALVLGFALTNHLSSLFLAPGLMVLFFVHKGLKGGKLSAVAVAVILVCLPLTMYSLLPIRSAELPAVNWGWVHRSWTDFLYHVKGTQFSVWLFSDSGATSRNLKDFGSMLGHTLLFAGIPVAIVGMIVLLRRARSIFLMLLLCSVVSAMLVASYSIPDIENYFLPAHAIACLFFAVGVATFTRMPSPILYALMMAPLIVGLARAPEMNRSTDHTVENYTRWILDNAEQDAVILSHQWDYFCSALQYLQVVEGVRTDVEMVEKELLRRTWYPLHIMQHNPELMKGLSPLVEDYMVYLRLFEEDSDAFNRNPLNVKSIQIRFVRLLNAILDSNAHRPLYVTHEMLSGEDGFAANYYKIPVGPLVRLVPPGSVPSVSDSRSNYQRLASIEASLTGRTQRLDKGIASLIANVLRANTDWYRSKGERDSLVALTEAASLRFMAISRRK